MDGLFCMLMPDGSELTRRNVESSAFDGVVEANSSFYLGGKKPLQTNGEKNDTASRFNAVPCKVLAFFSCGD